MHICMYIALAPLQVRHLLDEGLPVPRRNNNNADNNNNNNVIIMILRIIMILIEIYHTYIL